MIRLERIISTDDQLQPGRDGRAPPGPHMPMRPNRRLAFTMPVAFDRAQRHLVMRMGND